jgi:hypothetical protein
MKKIYHAFSAFANLLADFSGLFGRRLTVLLFSAAALTSCAYRITAPERSLPQGYRQMTVPIFKNFSQEVGVEVAFTNSLIQEFERSQVARVVDPQQAEVTIEGEIRSIGYNATKQELAAPLGTTLAGSYQVFVTVMVTVRRLSDKSVLWAGEFKRTDSHSAPHVTLAGINTVNPLYNLSARRQKLEVLAGDMMAEAHDRITENF